jgi:hypothetical protein
MQTSDLPGYPEFARGLDERGLNKGTFAVSASRGDGGALVGILLRRDTVSIRYSDVDTWVADALRDIDVGKFN